MKNATAGRRPDAWVLASLSSDRQTCRGLWALIASYITPPSPRANGLTERSNKSASIEFGSVAPAVIKQLIGGSVERIHAGYRDYNAPPDYNFKAGISKRRRRQFQSSAAEIFTARCFVQTLPGHRANLLP
jgi:hypothetical protein